MKILFTGASSFTGFWFVQELVQKGHHVTTIFPRKQEKYEGLRKIRMEKIITCSTPLFDAPFGSTSFLDGIKEGNWDLFCHHAADVTDYRSPDFDFAKALANNTKNLKEVLATLQNKGCHTLLLTGSVFEQGEGVGSNGLRAVSPYGLSKGLTAEVFRYFCSILGFKLGKFVIPNPFGPYEEGRFTSFLAYSWLNGKVPCVASPDYVRDNIHVSLLAKAYSAFANKPFSDYEVFRPSGYQENQGAFTRRFADAMEKRWGMSCPFQLSHQALFPEPKIRINTDFLDSRALEWNEEKAWDHLAEFYRSFHGSV